MNNKTLSTERGITLLENGNQIIIHSSYYGVVAEGTRETEHNDDYTFSKAIYHLNICEWYGYWDLKSIIKRGISRYEKNDWKMDLVEIYFNTIQGQQMHLNKYIELNLVER